MDDRTDDDATLVRRSAAGDRDALASVFDRFAPTLTRFAWALADSPDAARSLVQDTFGTFWQRAAEVELATTSLLPWLLATCRATSDAARVLTAAPAPVGDPLRWVRAELDTLTPADRGLVERCAVDGRGYDEVARDLGLPTAPVVRPVAGPARRRRKAVMRDGH